MYFNTHTHLNSEQLYPNRDQFIQNALDHQVENMVVVGYDLESSKKAVEIAHEYSFIYAAVGISPNDCKDTTDEDLNKIEKLLQDPCVVALGEIGLDYYWEEVPHEKQKDIFIKQIEIAKKYQKPIVIHARDAYEDTYNILKQTAHYGIMHCYSGSAEMAKRLGRMAKTDGTHRQPLPAGRRRLVCNQRRIPLKRYRYGMCQLYPYQGKPNRFAERNARCH